MYYSVPPAVLKCDKDRNDFWFEKDVSSIQIYRLPESAGFIS